MVYRVVLVVGNNSLPRQFFANKVVSIFDKACRVEMICQIWLVLTPWTPISAGFHSLSNSCIVAVAALLKTQRYLVISGLINWLFGLDKGLQRKCLPGLGPLRPSWCPKPKYVKFLFFIIGRQNRLSRRLPLAAIFLWCHSSLGQCLQPFWTHGLVFMPVWQRPNYNFLHELAAHRVPTTVNLIN